MPTIKRICPVCGKQYGADTGRLKHGKQTTCSRKCSYALRSESKKSGTIVHCARCGKPIYSTPSRQKKGHDIYCSIECKNPPVVAVCPTCGNEFRYSPSSEQTYCSKECSNLGKGQNNSAGTKAAWSDPEKRKRIMDGIKRRSQSEQWKSAPHFQRGEKHPKYNGNRKARQDASRYQYKQWHSLVLKACDYTCQRCGIRGGKLEAHHVKSWANHPELRFDVSNGIALCEDCHLSTHNRNRKPITKTCKHCGEKYRPNKSAQKYCSRECFYESMRK